MINSVWLVRRFIRGNRRAREGYLLPPVIALGLGIGTMSILAFQVVSQNSAILNDQYYNAIAREAARAGTAAATACIDAGDTSWSDDGDADTYLTPATGCDGVVDAGKSANVVDQTSYTSTYRVDNLQLSGSGNLAATFLTTTGTVSIKDTTGAVVKNIVVSARTLGKVNRTEYEAITGISTGNYFGCSTSEGKAYCWGRNAEGQIGNGISGFGAESNVPAAVYSTGALNGRAITAIASGNNHTCVIANDRPFCWGRGNDGRLGNGSTAGSNVPVAVNTSGVLSGKVVTALTAGDGHTCAIAEGKAYCWGYNNHGQLGNGTNTDSSVPVAVNASGVLAGKTVTAIAAGFSTTCAIADARVYCWGNNNQRMFGNNSITGSSVPVATTTSGVLSGKAVTDISLSDTHTCAIATERAYCWGLNSEGQLGNNSTTLSAVPVAVSTAGVLNGKKVTAISTGSQFTCAAADDEAYCWGSNYYGELGDGNGFPRRSGYTTVDPDPALVPVAVSTAGVLNGKKVTKLSASNNQVCAIASGWNYCWGTSSIGNLGDGRSTRSNIPVVTMGIPNPGIVVSDISAAKQHSCMAADGNAYCWGLSSYNRLGASSSLSGFDTSIPVPIAVSRDGVLSGKTVTRVATGDQQSCAIADGRAYCWGRRPNASDGVEPYAISTSGVLAGRTVTSISMAGEYACVVASARAYCWGDGNLGTASGSNSGPPVAVDTSGVLNGKTVTDISAGQIGACAVASARAYCWGTMLGDGTGNISNTPVAVSTSGVLNGKTVTAVSSGFSHNCAVADGRAYCWGSGANGRLGNNSTANQYSPVAVNTSGVLSNKTVTAISAGKTHTCAIADSKAYCWGDNPYGQLGTVNTASTLVPVAVSVAGVLNAKRVTAISAAEDHTCAIADEQAYCWGRNSDGQLGDNSNTSNMAYPVPVLTSGPQTIRIISTYHFESSITF